MANNDKGYAREAVQLRTGRDLEGLLRELYIDKRATQHEIAAVIGVSRSLVKEWLGDYGISRDERPPVVIEPVQA